MACSPISTSQATRSAGSCPQPNPQAPIPLDDRQTGLDGHPPAPDRERVSVAFGSSGRDMAHWVTIIQRVWSCGRQLRRWLGENLAPWQLTDSEFLLLFSCSQASGQGLAQTDLSGALGMSPAQISNLVDQLVRKDLLQVSRPPLDRRRQVVQLSSRGARLVETILGNLAPVAARLEPAHPLEPADSLKTGPQETKPQETKPQETRKPLDATEPLDPSQVLVQGEAVLQGLEPCYKAAG